MSAKKQQDALNLSDLSAALPAAASGLSAEDRAGLVNALKDKLQSLAGKNSNVMENLSEVWKRLEALKEIQSQHDEFEAKFFEERATLEAKYRKLYEPLYTKSQHDEFEAKFFEERATLEAKYQKLYEPLYTKALTLFQQKKFTKQRRKAAWDVPIEVIIEIVSWLPTSSVLRFKTVSRNWNDMIIDPVLADMHLSRGYLFGRPLVLLEISDLTKINLDLMAVEGGSLKRIVEGIEDSVRVSKRSLIMAIGGGRTERIAEGTEDRVPVSVSASSEGLICLYTAMEMVVFNPATGERLQLPEPTLSAGLSECCIGYHPGSRQLTVARFYDPTNGHFKHMETYHREKGTWSNVKADFYRDLSTGSVTVGRNMFFLGCSGGAGEDHRVVAFDMRNGRIKDVKYPWSTTTSTVWTLSNYDGNACVTVWSYDGTEIWVLHDVTKGFWSMMYRLRQSDFFLFPPRLAFHQEWFLLPVARNLRLRNLATGKSRELYARKDCRAAQFLRPSLVRLINSQPCTL